MRTAAFAIATIAWLGSLGCARDCPWGTVVVQRDSPSGGERWCEGPGAGGIRARQGPYRAWWPSGAPRAEAAYVDGQRDGPFLEWRENGRLKTVGSYASGNPTGLWHAWYDDGQLQTEALFPAGHRRSWFRNGTLRFEGEYRGLVRVGHCRAWYDDGGLKLDETLPNGRRMTYLRDGTKTGEGPIRNGRPHGQWFVWDETREPLWTGGYREGVRHGPWVFFQRAIANPKPKMAVLYRNGAGVGLIPADRVESFGRACWSDGLAACCEQDPTCRERVGSVPPER